LKLISYGEVVLSAQAADRRHPAFNNFLLRVNIFPMRMRSSFIAVRALRMRSLLCWSMR